jgi:hypothetical protein
MPPVSAPDPKQKEMIVKDPLKLSTGAATKFGGLFHNKL